MSYILDALRRADAERQRGDVPGLHAQPAAGATLPPDAQLAPSAGWAGKPLILVLLGGLVVAAGVVLGWLGRGPGAVPSVAPVAAPTAAPMAAPTAPPTAAPTTAPTAAPTAVPAAVPAAAVAPPMLPALAEAPRPAPVPVPRQAPPPSATPAPFTVIVPVPVPMPAPAPMAAAPAAPAAAAASDPVLALASLSESTRRSLPALAWSGVVFADRAEQRLVVVNGQVAREGDEIAVGLKLLQIRAKSVVLRWRGQRIELPV